MTKPAYIGLDPTQYDAFVEHTYGLIGVDGFKAKMAPLELLHVQKPDCYLVQCPEGRLALVRVEDMENVSVEKADCYVYHAK